MSVRRFLAIAALWMALVGMYGLEPSHARAEEPHAGEAGEKVNLFQPAIELSIWTLVVFVILLVILRLLAWGPMLEGLQKREQNIMGALQEAQGAREEAQRLRQDLDAKMARAAEDVRELMDTARKDAGRAKDEMIAEARAEIHGERDRLRREIETARDQALQQLWNRTAELATIISSKAIRRQLTPDDHRRLLDEALQELNQAARSPGRSFASTRG